MQLDNAPTYFNPYTLSFTTDLERDTKHLTNEEKRKLLSFNVRPLTMDVDALKEQKGRMSPLKFASSTSLNANENAISFGKGAKATLSKGFQITLGEKSFEWSGDVQRNPIGLEQAGKVGIALSDLIRWANGQVDHLTMTGEGTLERSSYALEGLKAFGIDTTKDFSINGTGFFVNSQGEIQKENSINAQTAYESLNNSSRQYRLTEAVANDAINLLSKYYLPNASDTTMQAWQDAMKETGINPFQWGTTNVLKVLSLEQDLATGGNIDLFGETVESTAEGVEKILDRLENPAGKVDEQRNAEERIFYESFLNKLNSEVSDPATDLVYEMKAEYVNSSTTEDPVVKVSLSNEKGSAMEYFVNINEVDPQNATQIEMFALCSYEDSKGNNANNNSGNWNILKGFQKSEFTSFEDASGVKQDWPAIVRDKTKEYMDVRLYKQMMEGNQLLNIFEKYGEKAELSDTDKQLKAAAAKVEKDILPDISDLANIIDCKDIDGGNAFIEFWGTGEIHFNNGLNEKDSWTMEVTTEQLLKAKQLEGTGDKYLAFMSDKSFWENYLNGDMTLEDLEKQYSKINNQATQENILSKFTGDVKAAWEKAEEDSGINGFGANENSLYLSEFIKKYLMASMKGEETDLLGSSAESMLEFAKEMLERLQDKNQPALNQELQKLKGMEKLFYQNLIENLNNL